MNGQAHTFDSFECAIHALAPTCKHCGTRIIGHDLERDGTYAPVSFPLFHGTRLGVVVAFT